MTFERLLTDGLRLSAERKPDAVAVIDGDRRRTYRELLDGALRLAVVLRARGVRRGDRVAVYLENSWEAAVSIYGTLLAGGVFLMVNPQTKPDKLAYILRDSGSRALISEARLARFFLPALSALPELRGVLCAGGIPREPVPPGAVVEPLEPALAQVSPEDPGVSPLAVDLAALIYTSGSTGDPKGVMMTHQSMVFTVGSLAEYLRLSEADRILNVLPLAFDYGLYQLLLSVRLGATLVLERSFAYPAKVLRSLSEEGATVFPGVPTIFAMLVAMHRRNALSFPSVARVTNTAAALPESYLKDLQEIFPNALLYKMYGLTECKRVCYLEPELAHGRPGSVGKAIPGTETFLLTPEGGPVPPGEIGILHVRGPHVMRGYWNKPEQTNHMLKDGRLPNEKILCTHDWFRTDEEGFLYFCGRSDDIIKSRGEKVSPVEVEGVLYGIPGIREAAVVGAPDEVLGEAVHAYVALEEAGTLTEKEIQKRCLERLENFMVPARVFFRESLPKTDTGKIKKDGLSAGEGNGRVA